ncbi:MAG TPA: hypothetical protein ENN28_03920 [Candidatus Uhrbacteria bacterium]|nr:hypothetical protein [Candidatus Uhrbacteria bacterium]
MNKKNYLFLRALIVSLIIIFFTISQIINLIYFAKSFDLIIIDGIFTLIIAILIMEIVLKLIKTKEKQLESQIEQLTEAYQYIGQVNRKIDALLELDISALDRSKKRSIHESSTNIFNQLINLTHAQAGLLYFKPPIDFKFFKSKAKHPELKKTLELFSNSEIKGFKYSQNENNSEFFQSLCPNSILLKKLDFVTKPIYMHDKDVGIMVLAFKKNHYLEDRDFNIIRVYSFYLALNYTFKPDFSIYQP